MAEGILAITLLLEDPTVGNGERNEEAKLAQRHDGSTAIRLGPVVLLKVTENDDARLDTCRDAVDGLDRLDHHLPDGQKEGS